jgi:hypothetical protein
MSPRRRPVRNIARTACALALLYAGASVAAQAIYKEIDSAGHVTYSDQPDTTPSWHQATVPAVDVKNALAGNSAISSRRAAIVDADEAARRLSQALEERRLGAERLPGERAHGADAAAANLRYRARQEDLDREVGLAMQRVSLTARSLRTSP